MKLHKNTLKTLWEWLQIGWKIFTSDRSAALFMYDPECKTIYLKSVNLQSEGDAVHLADLYAVAYRHSMSRKIELLNEMENHLN